MSFSAVIALLAAGVVGYAMKRGGLCSYAAVLQWIREGRAERMVAFLAITAWATVAVIPFAWRTGDMVLPSTHSQPLAVLAGGLLLGLGAYINRGCVFGTFVQLVGGNLNYLATLLGTAGAVALSHIALQAWRPVTGETAWAATPAGAGLAWVVLAALLALGLVVRLAHRREWLALFIVLALGIGGGWLYALVAGWNFGAVLSGAIAAWLGASPSYPSMLAVACTLALVGGGLTAAFSSGSFHLQRLHWRGFGSRLLGGLAMGVGAFVTPGGNDGMLLNGIPALAPHALGGYLVMLVTIGVLLRWAPNEQGYQTPG